MNVKRTRIVCLFLMLVMLVGTVAACKPKSSDSDGTSEQDTTTPDPSPGTEAERYYPEKEDMNGYTYRMLLDGDAGNVYGHLPNYDCVTDDGQEDTLDSAFFSRNRFLENHFNITIEVKTLGTTPFVMKQHLRECMLGNEDFADTIFGVAGNVMNTVIPEGLVLNINHINGFNLDASYWDQQIQQEYSVNNMLFTLEGDYTVKEELTTFVVFFNDMLYEKYGYSDTYGSLYDMVKDGSWTLDQLMRMVKDASTENDNPYQKQWGMFAEAPVPYIFYLGAGGHAITHDDDGNLELLFTDKTEYNNAHTILEDAIKQIGINKDVLVIDVIANDPSSGQGWPTFFKMFSNDLALFNTATLGEAAYFSEMKNLFGVLPIPKYTEDQNEYFSWCSSQSHMPLMVPVTALSHAETTAKIAEAMCYFSKYPYSEKSQTVVDAEFEWLMVNKICRTSDDREMLELIFANKTYDLDFATYMSGIPQVVVNHTGNGTLDRFTANLKGEQGSALGKLTQFIRETTNNVVN